MSKRFPLEALPEDPPLIPWVQRGQPRSKLSHKVLSFAAWHFISAG